MERYRIEYASSIRRDLRKIDKQEVPRILAAIEALAEQPRPVSSKKLTGEELYRIRVGNYRVLYEIIDDRLVIMVIGVRHRKEIYRK